MVTVQKSSSALASDKKWKRAKRKARSYGIETLPSLLVNRSIDQFRVCQRICDVGETVAVESDNL